MSKGNSVHQVDVFYYRTVFFDHDATKVMTSTHPNSAIDLLTKRTIYQTKTSPSSLDISLSTLRIIGKRQLGEITDA